MADESAVMDAVETGAEEVESGAEEVEQGQEQVDEGEAEEKGGDKGPYTTQFSREYRAAMKALELQHPEQKKFLQQARDNHARLFALTQLEPKGIDGVREHYAMLDGLVRGDFKGPEALTAIQEELAGVEEVDNLLINGDPKAFDALGEDFNAGLAKLAPAYLERVAQTDPAAFEAAVLPHFVSTLAGSDLVKEFNALVDVLNAKDDPRFDDATKMKFAMSQLAKMGNWLNGLQAKVGEIKPAGAAKDTQQADPQKEIERERQELHWERSIYPEAGKLVRQKFNELLAPLQKRLKLTPKQVDSAYADFKSKNTAACEADADYIRQKNFYRGQKNPSPEAVLNMVRAQLAKTGKTVFEQVRSERWEGFLSGTPKPTPQPGKDGKITPKGPASPNVEVRTVMPPRNEIDFQHTPIDWMASTRPGGKQYRLFSGKVIQVRPA